MLRYFYIKTGVNYHIPHVPSRENAKLISRNSAHCCLKYPNPGKPWSSCLYGKVAYFGDISNVVIIFHGDVSQLGILCES